MSLTPLCKAWPLIVRVISSFMRSLCAMHKCKRISIDRSYVGTIIFTRKATGKPRPGYVCWPLWVRYPSRTAGLFWYRGVSASLGFDTRKLPRVSESVHLGVSESVLENMNPGYHSRLTLQAMTGPAGRYFEPYRCHSESMFGIYVRRLVDSM
jgi:hypothetical protein